MRITAILFSLFLIFQTSTVAANDQVKDMPSGLYALDKAHASLIWKVSHLGLSDYTARFTKFDATLDFNAQNPSASTLSVTIDPSSVETDYPNPEQKDFDKKLATGEDWFNAKEFPKITFTSKRIEMTGDKTGTVYGTLDFLGKQHPLALDVTFNKAMIEQPFAKKPALGFSATANLQRSQWGFDTYVPNIGDSVNVIVEAEFLKADENQE